MHFTNIVASLGAVSVAIGAAVPRQQTSLYKAMTKAGKQFVGAAITWHNETQENDILKNDFNSITPENAMKWDATEPNRGQFTFDGADVFANYARKNKVQLHCHNLLWHEALPQWVLDGKFDNATLIGVLENHIKNMVTRYKDVCTRWDVVNEALNDDGTLRQSIWYNTTGEAYLPIAFSLAHKYNPNVKLFYNDYNLEYNSAKTKGAAYIYNLVKSYGVRIDGVGYQSHMVTNTPGSPDGCPDQAGIEAALQVTTKLGGLVALTEIDARMPVPSNQTSLDSQAECYRRLAAACIATKNCIGMTTWGLSDKYSPAPQMFPGQGAALMWDENWKQKPAYDGLLKGITGGY